MSFIVLSLVSLSLIQSHRPWLCAYFCCEFFALIIISLSLCVFSFPASETCKLTCISQETRKVFVSDLNVIDGTFCSYDQSNQVCVKGVCQVSTFNIWNHRRRNTSAQQLRKRNLIALIKLTFRLCFDFAS